MGYYYVCPKCGTTLSFGDDEAPYCYANGCIPDPEGEPDPYSGTDGEPA